MASYRESIDVRAPISETYKLFADFERFPSFMEGVEEVKRTGPDRLHWRAGIAGREEAWEAEVTEQLEDSRISWASVSGTNNAGTVTFDKLDDDTTRVHMEVEYEPQGFMETVGATLGGVNGRMRGDLQRFKDLAESQHADAETYMHEAETDWREGETRWHDPVEEGRPVDYDPAPRRVAEADMDDTPTTSESRRLGEGEDPAVDADDVPLSKEDQRLEGGDLLPPTFDEDDRPITDLQPTGRRPPTDGEG